MGAAGPLKLLARSAGPVPERTGPGRAGQKYHGWDRVGGCGGGQGNDGRRRLSHRRFAAVGRTAVHRFATVGCTSYRRFATVSRTPVCRYDGGRWLMSRTTDAPSQSLSFARHARPAGIVE